MIFILKRKKLLIAFITCLNFTFVASCGTLGGIGDQVYFPTSKKKLENAIDSLYSSRPEYKMPEKWKQFDDWSARGYDFLECRMFYFKAPPEEMYYVTFIGDSAMLADPTKIGIGIQAICPGDDRWLLDKDLNSKQKERIGKRFEIEIISKLEKYTNTTSTKE